MVRTLVFDEDYRGARWRYGLARPVMIGALPRDYIIGSVRPHPGFVHGTIDYSRELREREVRRYGLTLVATILPGE